MSDDRFPRAGRLHKGYHRRQVDHFLNHVEVALGGVLPVPTAAEVRQAGFEMVRNGYDTLAVDEALDEPRGACPDRAAGERRPSRPGRPGQRGGLREGRARPRRT